MRPHALRPPLLTLELGEWAAHLARQHRIERLEAIECPQDLHEGGELNAVAALEALHGRTADAGHVGELVLGELASDAGDRHAPSHLGDHRRIRRINHACVSERYRHSGA